MSPKKNSFSKIGVFLFLFLITAVMIFLPQRTNAQRGQTLLQKQYTGKIIPPNQTKITDKLVANLFCQNEFIEYKPLHTEEYMQDAEFVFEKAYAIITCIFPPDNFTFDTFKSFFQNSVIDGRTLYTDFSQEIILSMYDSQPMALVLTFLSIETDICNFFVAFEEKTKTVISFYFNIYIFDPSAPSAFEELINQDLFENAVKNYYEIHLELEENKEYEWYFYFDPFDKLYMKNDFYNYHSNIGFSLIQTENPEKIKKIIH